MTIREKNPVELFGQELKPLGEIQFITISPPHKGSYKGAVVLVNQDESMSISAIRNYRKGEFCEKSVMVRLCKIKPKPDYDKKKGGGKYIVKESESKDLELQEFATYVEGIKQHFQPTTSANTSS